MFRSKEEQPTIDVLPLKDAVLSYTKVPLEYQPGTNYKYSNAGITVVGYILEQTQKEPFARYLKRTLLQPLGLDRAYAIHLPKLGGEPGVERQLEPALFAERGRDH